MAAITAILNLKILMLNNDFKESGIKQLKANPNCCIGAGDFFAEATAEFLGATMSDANAPLREIYCEKFPGAFDEGVDLGGRDAEFILLKPVKLKGWAFENDLPTEDGVPTVPFEIDWHNM